MKDKELERLLELASLPEQPGDCNHTEAERFVREFGIKEGSTKITPFQVWYAYEGWAEKPIGRWTFCCQFSKLFPQYKKDRERFYLLDPGPFDLSQDTYFRQRARMRKDRGREKRIKTK